MEATKLFTEFRSDGLHNIGKTRYEDLWNNNSDTCDVRSRNDAFLRKKNNCN